MVLLAVLHLYQQKGKTMIKKQKKLDVACYKIDSKIKKKASAKSEKIHKVTLSEWIRTKVTELANS